jgi:hypothetical protein
LGSSPVASIDAPINTHKPKALLVAETGGQNRYVFRLMFD